MIIMRMKGGLGNQLFQYATGYALSKRLNQPLKFNLSFTSNMKTRQNRLFELNVEVDATVNDSELPGKVLKLKNKYINKAMRILHINKSKYVGGLYWLETKEVYLPEIFTITADNLYVDGYFQSPRYFEQYREVLVKQITPKYEAEQSYLDILKDIYSCNSVAVHVRRSDFKKDINKFHYILNLEYYRKAVEYIRQHSEKPVFFWFSDEIQWVKENIDLGDDFRFVTIRTAHSDIDDMMLMKNCNHIITANSTFSWWAAWLNIREDAIRVVPAKQYGNSQMIPHGWVKI